MKKGKKTDWENVKIRKVVLDRLRKHKEQTHIPILKMVELAVIKYLEDATS